MCLADMWNRALMKRANPSAANGPPDTASQPTVKRSKSGELSQPSDDPNAYLDDYIAEMSDAGVDAALQELLKDDAVNGQRVLEVVPNSVPGDRKASSSKQRMSCVDVLPGCCGNRRQTQTHIPPPGVPSASLPQEVNVQQQPGSRGTPSMQQTPSSAAALLQQQQPQKQQPDDPMKVDESPSSVMRMLYPNLFH